MKFYKKNKEAGVGNGKAPISNDIQKLILHQRGNVDEFFPADFSEDERKNINLVKKFTMSSYERLVALSRGIDYIEEHSIQGDIVECGVWKGGSMMMAALRLLQIGKTDRILFLFDTYEGMSTPTSVDKTMSGEFASDLLLKDVKGFGDNMWCLSPLEEVRANIYATNYPREKIHFIPGKVEETLPHESIEKIAVLRLDTDWYESTMHELEVLYDCVVPGGIIIIDDYGHWAGAKKAVDEFIQKRGLKIYLHRIDYTGRLIIKVAG